MIANHLDNFPGSTLHFMILNVVVVLDKSDVVDFLDDLIFLYKI